MNYKKVFLITKSGFDYSGNFTVVLYGKSMNGNGVKIIITDFNPLFFVPSNTPLNLTEKVYRRVELDLKSIDGVPVDCLYFKSQQELVSCKEELNKKLIRTYEADINPVDRYLMERDVRGGFYVEGEYYEENGLMVYKNPKIRGCDVLFEPNILSIDIETNYKTNEILSISFSGNQDKVFVVGQDTDSNTIKFQSTEKELLTSTIEYIKEIDPDIIVGWYVINFDIKMLLERTEFYGLNFQIGRSNSACRIYSEQSGRLSAFVDGRVILDAMELLRYNRYSFESYSLDFVASKLLSKQKLITDTGTDKAEEIIMLFESDKKSLAEYNLQDSILVKEILAKTGVIQNSIEYTKLSGMLLDTIGGNSIAAFDYLYLPKLHRKGFVAKNKSDADIKTHHLSGGFVIESIPGLYDNVLVLDFKSLYPTIIMTFLIDPLGFYQKSGDSIKTPAGTSFSRELNVLPNIISNLFEARAEAKATQNDSLSYSIKILMNSFYGVLGSAACRFFSSDIAETITKTGRYILHNSVEFIENEFDCSVIYGDTDSIFIHIGSSKENEADNIGYDMVDKTNSWLRKFIPDNFKTESKLELEYECHYRYFFMPTIRGSDVGSKKRYCGAKVTESPDVLDLTFKGMESARGDWTDIAHEFQHELYKLVFLKKPVDEYILATVNNIRTGMVDEKLIYKKHIRKKLSEYTKHVPPHVQAAKLLNKDVRVVSYYITKNGPIPVELFKGDIDYEHYIESQIAPIAEAILKWIGKNFDQIISGQQDLFSGL